MIRKTLALFVFAALVAAPAFATTGTSSGGGGGAAASSGGGHSGGGGGGGHSGGGSGGHSGGGARIGASLSGPHARSAAHAISAHSASSAHHHHHHFTQANFPNNPGNYRQNNFGCPALTTVALEKLEVCGGPSKTRIDPTSGRPAP